MNARFWLSLVTEKEDEIREALTEAYKLSWREYNNDKSISGRYSVTIDKNGKVSKPFFECNSTDGDVFAGTAIYCGSYATVTDIEYTDEDIISELDEDEKEEFLKWCEGNDEDPETESALIEWSNKCPGCVGIYDRCIADMVEDYIDAYMDITEKITMLYSNLKDAVDGEKAMADMEEKYDASDLDLGDAEEC